MPRAGGLLAIGIAGALGFGLLGAACGGSAAPSATQQQYLAAVHEAAPDIGSYLSDSRVVALGEATCNDLSAKVAVPEIADRLSPSNLPSADLGAIMASAGEVLCPKYGSVFSGGS